MLKTNAKKVREAVRAHMLDHFDNDQAAMIRDAKSAGGWSEAVQAGCFCCYYYQAREFLREALQETQEEADRYDDEKVWNLYKALIVMEGQKMERSAAKCI